MTRAAAAPSSPAGLKPAKASAPSSPRRRRVGAGSSSGASPALRLCAAAASPVSAASSKVRTRVVLGVADADRSASCS
eukprot:5191373-Pleurochrysis_carterae.AAC.1